MLGEVVVTGHRIKLVEIGPIIFVTAYIFVGFYSLYMLRDWKSSTYRIFTTYYLVYWIVLHI